MNIASFFVNKCFEYLLSKETEKAKGDSCVKTPGASLPFGPSHQPFFPPGVREPHLFQSNCDGCGVCMETCENGILVADSQGCPRVDFTRGGCSFCGGCAENCPKGLFSYEPSGIAWDLQASIIGSCLAHRNVLCRTCEEHCEEEAIIISKTNGTISPPRILAEKCSGCGACYSSCPVRAISIVNTQGSENS